jgi:hypothetical protein
MSYPPLAATSIAKLEATSANLIPINIFLIANKDIKGLLRAA